MNTRNTIIGAITGTWMLLATGCGGSGSSGDESPAAPAPVDPPASQTVGGSTFGLHGTLVLALNGGNPLTLTADDKFVFTNVLPAGSSYAVTVETQPVNQICTVANGSGTIAGTAVTNVTVNCSVITRVVGGTVYGLDASEIVVLQNNTGDDLAISANGNFSFATPVAQSGAYSVTVHTQPATQTCSVSNGNGTAGTSDIDDVQVICSTNAYTVGGTVSGLVGTVVLQNNGADDLNLSGNGPFTFAAPVAQGATYNITVATQPPMYTCVVTNCSGTMGGANVANVGLSCTLNTTTLSASVSDLALSVTGLTEYGVGVTPPTASGVARTITITNTGSDNAINLAVTPPTWPSGTISSTNCGSTLVPSASCTITVTPGNTPTTDGTGPCSSGTAPQPGTIQVTGDNTNTLTSNVVVLTYGCIYRGGYVYALDDSQPATQSVTGKVAAITDQASSALWSSDGNGPGSADFSSIYGTSEISTTVSPNPGSGGLPGQTGCEGAIDGACNTNNIYEFYQTAMGSPVNPADYAAGLCKQTISGYTDWYLPAICELGYGMPFCGDAISPSLQNMQSSLVNNGMSLAGVFWSSTTESSTPAVNAFYHYFDVPGATFQSPQAKNNMYGVRCSRAF